MTENLSCDELTSCRIAGQSVRRFELRSPLVSVELMEWGATVLSVHLTDRSGASFRVTRDLPSPELYAQNPAYMGSICGRYAGRIAHARFALPQSEPDRSADVNPRDHSAGEVLLSANQGQHHLHGGEQGFSHRLWKAQLFSAADRVGVSFNYLSAHGEEGYPGTLDTQVTYSLDRRGRLRIDYLATVLDWATVVNLTSHCYWNFSAAESVREHELRLGAHSALIFDAELLPTGASLAVQGSALDFRRARKIGDALQHLPAGAAGFDHCFHGFDRFQSLEDLAAEASESRPETAAGTDLEPGLLQVAQVADPISGRGMRVYTDQPGLVFYTGNALDGSAEVGGHNRHSALCLECQQFPDAPNQLGFPNPAIAPGESYRQTTVYELFLSATGLV